MTQFFTQNIIAVIWDFDKTLIPGHMQAPLFAKYNIEEKKFWDEVNQQSEERKKQGYSQISNEVMYLNHILSHVKNGTFKDLNNEKLRLLGSELEFYPGLPEFFDEIKQSIANEKYKEHDIKVEHYVVSTGLRQIILGSAINQYLDGVWGCELLDTETSNSQYLSAIGYVLDHTTKTRAIFEINKGVNVQPNNIDVNSRMEESKRRVPIPQMIYIADGPSDVPVFSVVKRFGGRTCAVYNPESKLAYKQAYDLMYKEHRVDTMGAANYQHDTQIGRWLIHTVKIIADDIINQRMSQLESSVGSAPEHLIE